MKAVRGQHPLTPASDGVRLIVFDFDQTLSVIHVFKTLAGWSKDAQVPKPHATTELGQIRRITELSQLEPYKAEKGGFACLAFGGEARVEQIREMLQRLKARDVNLIICTKGLVGTVRKCLSDLDLLDFFSEVYGNVGNNYGETRYDEEVARSKPTSKEVALLATPEKGAWKSKDKLIFQLASRAGLSRDQAVLVEDDAEEIRRAAPVSRTLWVREAAGMTPRHCAALLQLVEGSARKPGSGNEDMALNRSADSRFSDRLPGRFEAKNPGSRGSDAKYVQNDANIREFSTSRGSQRGSRKFERPLEEVSGNMSVSDGSSRLDGASRIELDLARLSLDDDCRAPVQAGRRSKSCVETVSKVNRRTARPASRGSHSRTLAAAGSRLMASSPPD